MSGLRVDDVHMVSARQRDRERGLLGWVSCVLNDSLRVDGIALRRTTDGRLTLSYPAHRDGAGRQHFYVRPLTDVARREIEDQVFAALGLCQEARR